MHNYKSRDESILYKNREESRDAFLYQLRYFQNVRGRVLDTSELESSLLRIRRSATNVIQGVQVQNMHCVSTTLCQFIASNRIGADGRDRQGAVENN
jgi:hypothetical protein